MSILIETNEKIFNENEIRRGMLVYARHKTWSDGIGGIVTRTARHEITVQYAAGVSNVTNHFFITSTAVAAQEFEILRWSEDLETVSGGDSIDAP